MIDERQVRDALATIPDPEMPISIVDLGMVHAVRLDAARGTVEVDILPTFVGCPALDVIRERIGRTLSGLDGVVAVHVRFVHDPPWTPDRISDAGRESLRRFGVVVPPRGAHPRSQAVPLTVGGEPPRPACPFCGSDNVRLESRFGPTRCKMIWYCAGCRNSFEQIKPV